MIYNENHWRKIYASLITSEKLSEVDSDCERIYTRSNLIADDHGRVKANIFEFKSKVLGGLLQKQAEYWTDELVVSCLQKLHDVGLIILYEDECNNRISKYFYIVLWYEHQSGLGDKGYRYKSSYPGPPEDILTKWNDFEAIRMTTNDYESLRTLPNDTEANRQDIRYKKEDLRKEKRKKEKDKPNSKAIESTRTVTNDYESKKSILSILNIPLEEIMKDPKQWTAEALAEALWIEWNRTVSGYKETATKKALINILEKDGPQTFIDLVKAIENYSQEVLNDNVKVKFRIRGDKFFAENGDWNDYKEGQPTQPAKTEKENLNYITTKIFKRLQSCGDKIHNGGNKGENAMELVRELVDDKKKLEKIRKINWMDLGYMENTKDHADRLQAQIELIMGGDVER